MIARICDANPRPLSGVQSNVFQQNIVEYTKDNLYRRSYQEAMQRPISIISYGSDVYKVRQSYFASLNHHYYVFLQEMVPGAQTTSPPTLGTATVTASECKGRMLMPPSAGTGVGHNPPLSRTAFSYTAGKKKSSTEREKSCTATR